MPSQPTKLTPQIAHARPVNADVLAVTDHAVALSLHMSSQPTKLTPQIAHARPVNADVLADTDHAAALRPLMLQATPVLTLSQLQLPTSLLTPSQLTLPKITAPNPLMEKVLTLPQSTERDTEVWEITSEI